jgi:hypothetical protein
MFDAIFAAGQRIAVGGLLVLPVGCRGDRVGGGADDDDTDTTEPDTADWPGTDPSDSDDAGDTDGPQEDVEVVELTPMEHLIRASMAIRGTRPSLSDLAQVEADPDALEEKVDLYLESAQFGETIRAMHNEALLVMPDYLYYPAGFLPIGELSGEDIYALNRSVLEAPLKLIEHVVMSDRPYSEIVTADYTVADHNVAVVWGLDYGGDGDSWEVTAWADGRDNAGVLSDSWLWQRHRSTDSNANRGRANAVASALLCADFLSNDVDVDVSIDLSDPNAVSEAVLDNPSCAACHAQLDPLASYFRGFFPAYVPQTLCDPGEPCAYPMEIPWFKELFPDLLDVDMQPPAYFGEQGDGLEFLGRQIADDPRFAECAVKRFYSYLLQVPLQDVPQDAEDELVATFEDSGLDAKTLVRAIVLRDEFKTSYVEAVDPSAPTDAELAAADYGAMKARPVALGQMMKDLTGFRWVTDLNGIPDGAGGVVDLGVVPLLEDSFLGYRVLGGGIDSLYVTQSSHTYTGPNFLVLDALAREAAHHVVERDFATGDRKLLGLVDADTRGEAAIRDQLVQLHLRLYGEAVEPDGGPVDRLYDLWSEMLEISDDPARAWKGTLHAMFQDLRIAYY